jgi:hypothetical protein
VEQPHYALKVSIAVAFGKVGETLGTVKWIVLAESTVTSAEYAA